MFQDLTEFEKDLVKKVISTLKKSELKIFPYDFIIGIDCIDEKIVNKILILGSEFFGSYEILTSDGVLFKMVNSLPLAKYYIYSSVNKKFILPVPTNSADIEIVVRKYENYFDELLKHISQLISQESTKVDKNKIINQVIQNLNYLRF
jgi:hypothetical protein